MECLIIIYVLGLLVACFIFRLIYIRDKEVYPNKEYLFRFYFDGEINCRNPELWFFGCLFWFIGLPILFVIAIADIFYKFLISSK